MKLELWQPPASTPPKEQVVKVRLIDCWDCFALAVVDESGGVVESGYLARLNKDGSLTLCTGVNPTLGLPLDRDGCIQIVRGAKACL